MKSRFKSTEKANVLRFKSYVRDTAIKINISADDETISAIAREVVLDYEHYMMMWATDDCGTFSAKKAMDAMQEKIIVLLFIFAS